MPTGKPYPTYTDVSKLDPNAATPAAAKLLKDSLAKFAASDPDEGMYPDYAVRGRYERDMGRYLLGVTSPGGFAGLKSAVVQLHEPTLLWVTEWTALHTDGCPEVPDSAPGDSRWELLDEYAEVNNVAVLDGDGTTPLYRVSGYYVYGCLDPSDQVLKDVRFGKPPWLIDTGFVRSIPAGKIKTNIITPDNDSAELDLGAGLIT